VNRPRDRPLLEPIADYVLELAQPLHMQTVANDRERIDYDRPVEHEFTAPRPQRLMRLGVRPSYGSQIAARWRRGLSILCASGGRLAPDRPASMMISELLE
jgi:hypothetical protein